MKMLGYKIFDYLFTPCVGGSCLGFEYPLVPGWGCGLWCCIVVLHPSPPFFCGLASFGRSESSPPLEDFVVVLPSFALSIFFGLLSSLYRSSPSSFALSSFPFCSENIIFSIQSQREMNRG